MTHDRLLLLDYGGVLGDHYQEPAECTLASLLHVDVPACRGLLSEKRDLGRAFREGRLTEEEFWRGVAARAGVHFSDLPGSAALSRLWIETYHLNEEIMELLLACRTNAYIGVLTNVDRARSEFLERILRLPERLDIYLPSYRFGAIKPDVELWRRADAAIAEKLGVVTTYYCDDRSTHVSACSAFGWRGLLYEHPAQFRDWLIAHRFITNRS